MARGRRGPGGEDKKFAGEKEWKVIGAVAKAVTSEANRCAGHQIPVPDFSEKTMQHLLLDAETRNPVSVGRTLVLSAGSTPYITSVSHSLVIVDGDFTGATSISNSLLIVRGNVGRVTGVRDSIILATGHWDGATSFRGSFAQVDNHQIRFTVCRNSVLINTAIRTTGDTDSRTIQSLKGPLKLLKFSPRPSNDRLAWSKGVNDLAVALAPTDGDGRFLIRWKNVGKESLQMPWARFHPSRIDTNRDDLLGHVFLKGPDGKRAPARKRPATDHRGSRLDRCVVLGPGRTHEEVIDLWSYVEKPADRGKYQLSVELEVPEGRRGMEWALKTWSGKIQSKTLEVGIGK